MKYAATCAAALLLLTTGCASIIHGTSQNIDIASDPTGATILIDDEEVGTTPFVAGLKRKERKTIRIELDGYSPYEVALDRKLDGWYFGNILFGGIIGLVVDAANGAMYKLTPSQIDAHLSGGSTASLSGDDTIYLAVVLVPQPDWERIATLDSEDN